MEEQVGFYLDEVCFLQIKFNKSCLLVIIMALDMLNNLLICNSLLMHTAYLFQIILSSLVIMNV